MKVLHRSLDANMQTVSVTVVAQPAKAKKARGKVKLEKIPCDPKLICAARELRDRYLEQVNAADAPPVLATAAKYDVARALPSPPLVRAAPAAGLPVAPAPLAA